MKRNERERGKGSHLYDELVLYSGYSGCWRAPCNSLVVEKINDLSERSSSLGIREWWLTINYIRSVVWYIISLSHYWFIRLKEEREYRTPERSAEIHKSMKSVSYSLINGWGIITPQCLIASDSFLFASLIWKYITLQIHFYISHHKIIVLADHSKTTFIVESGRMFDIKGTEYKEDSLFIRNLN